MNRRDFLRATGATALTAGLATTAPAGPTTSPAATRPAPFAIASAPVLLYPAPDAVTVSWSVTAPGTGWVEYGPTESLGQRALGDDAGLLPFSDRLLSVRLTNLKPGTRYFYRVHSSPVNFKAAYSIRRGATTLSTDLRSFTTPDPAAAECRFTVWNDTHENQETLDKLAGALAAAGPTDFLFWNGDIANAVDTEDDIVSNYFAPVRRPFADQTPLMFSRGNHDVRGRAARLLTRYLPFPGDRTYFAFRQGPVAFLVLDTGEDKPDDHPAYAGLAGFSAYRQEQRDWLESAVRHPDFTSAAFRVVFAHIPLVWDAPHRASWSATYGGTYRGWVCDDGLERWGPLLNSSRVDLVISGHTHAHAYFPPTPMRPWAQLIGGGPQLARATTITAHATASTLQLTTTLVGTGEVAFRQTLARRS